MIAYVLYGLVPVAIVVADRITKAIALTAYTMPQQIYPWLTFELVYNRGVSWGMFHDVHHHIGSLVALLVIIVLLSFIGYTWRRYTTGAYVLAELCVLAGAVSNLWDRWWHPGVIDFIHVHLGTWHWAIFNIADMAISLGVMVMLIMQYYESRSDDTV